MFARLSAKAILLTVALALVFFGIGLLGLSVAAALAPYAGVAGGDAIAGAILLVPPLVWALAVAMARPEPQPAGARELGAAVMAALAKETPWIAVVGAALTGAARLFLNRNKSRK